MFCPTCAHTGMSGYSEFFRKVSMHIRKHMDKVMSKEVTITGVKI